MPVSFKPEFVELEGSGKVLSTILCETNVGSYFRVRFDSMSSRSVAVSALCAGLTVAALLVSQSRQPTSGTFPVQKAECSYW